VKSVIVYVAGDRTSTTNYRGPDDPYTHYIDIDRLHQHRQQQPGNSLITFIIVPAYSSAWPSNSAWPSLRG